MPESDSVEIDQLSHRWADGERRADPAAIADRVSDDFRLVGPLGYILDRRGWEGRFAGGLTIDDVSWREVDVRVVGDTAVAVGTLTQRASYQGNRTDGTYRVSQTWARSEDGWKLLGAHYSPVAAAPAVERER